MSGYDEDSAREYSESLGQIFSGGWRQIEWAHRAGIPTALGMTTREWAVKFLGGAQRLTIDERREAVLELTSGSDGLSQRAAAEVLGISHETVRRDVGTFVPTEVISAQANGTNVPPRTNAQLVQASNSNEWYTPNAYLEAGRRVLGGIDLDPASCERAQQTVRAERFFSESDDGLTQLWTGRVWLNPPYGRQAGDFAAKLLDEYHAFNVTAAVLLVSAGSVGASWFQPLYDFLLCFTNHRIQFQSPDGEASGNTNTSVFAYLGPERERFAREFKAFGPIVARWAE